MDANELRRLNLVNYQGVVKIVNTVSLSMVGLSYPADVDQFEYPNISIKNIKPIPITEEILLKCGFVNDGFEYKKDNFFLFYQSLDKDGCVINTEFGKYKGATRFIFSFCIEYLHQLQNLYFALTQKELEINL